MPTTSRQSEAYGEGDCGDGPSCRNGRDELADRPEPQPAINNVVVQVFASGFVPTEPTWPSTWTDRLGRHRTPSIPGNELAGVVTALGYATTGLSIGQRVFGLADGYRDGTLAEYVAIEARYLAPLPRRR
jgi:NADPH:quinone reductase-like Zn-dependent oxidoreductase